jgi:hypothetical protein
VPISQREKLGHCDGNGRCERRALWGVAFQEHLQKRVQGTPENRRIERPRGRIVLSWNATNAASCRWKVGVGGWRAQITRQNRAGHSLQPHAPA